MAPAAELGPLIGSSLFAIIVAVIANRNNSKKPSTEKKIEESSVDIRDEFEGQYQPGQPMPNYKPDEVTKYYLNGMIDDETFQESATAIDGRDADTPDEWIPRHKELVRLTGRHPSVGHDSDSGQAVRHVAANQ